MWIDDVQKELEPMDHGLILCESLQAIIDPCPTIWGVTRRHNSFSIQRPLAFGQANSRRVAPGPSESELESVSVRSPDSEANANAVVLNSFMDRVYKEIPGHMDILSRPVAG